MGRSTRWKSPYTSKVTPPYNRRKVTVIGESPNARALEKYDTKSGQRLLDLSGGVVMPWHNIHGALPPKWSSRVARARTEDWVAMHPLDDEPFILLGRKVQAAFAIPRDALPFEWYASPEHRHSMIVFPHTSPSNRFWDDAAHVQEASELLAKLLNGDLPHHEYKNKEEGENAEVHQGSTSGGD